MFYSRLFQILVVSTVLLLGSIVLRRTISVRPWTRLLLALPLIWAVNRWISPLGWSSDAGHVLDTVLIILTVASVPFTMLALVRIMAPDYFALGGRRLKIAALAIMAIVFVGGLLVGQFNYRVTDCKQYVLAGDDLPANCRPTPGASPSP